MEKNLKIKKDSNRLERKKERWKEEMEGGGNGDNDDNLTAILTFQRFTNLNITDSMFSSISEQC
jgi:hypothetical protein